MVGVSRIAFFALLSLSSAAAAASLQPRPAITGISHIAVYSRDWAASDRFYGHVLGGRKAPDSEDPAGVRYYFGRRNFVEVLPAPGGQGSSMLAHVAYTTGDAAGLRRYLIGRGNAAGSLRSGGDGSRWFSVRDPEGNEVRFVQGGRASRAAPSAISTRIIHVGYLVHNRAAEASGKPTSTTRTARG